MSLKLTGTFTLKSPPCAPVLKPTSFAPRRLQAESRTTCPLVCVTVAPVTTPLEFTLKLISHLPSMPCLLALDGYSFKLDTRDSNEEKAFL